jgi:hypothetical protein
MSAGRKSPGRQLFKLIVQPNALCLELLRYLDTHIEEINQMSAAIMIEKIQTNEFDEATVNMFRKKGITRLPAMLSPEGKVFTGLKPIMELFDKNVKKLKMHQRSSAFGPEADAEFGSNPDLTDFWERELFAGYDKRGGRIARKDKDEPENEGADIERRVAEYQRNVPRHRTGGQDRGRDDRTRDNDRDRGRRGRGRRRRDDDSDDDEPDSDDDDGDRRRPAERDRRGGGGHNRALPTTEHDMDDRMMAAWMDNNGDH